MYYHSLNGMPPAGTVGEAVVKAWLLRERFMKGFTVWQLVLATSLGRTDPFLLAADHIGELISNIHMVMPLSIPDAWNKKFDSILRDAQFEVEKTNIKDQAKTEGNKAIVAERMIDPELAARAVDQWARMQDEQK